MSKLITIDAETSETLNEIIRWWRSEHGSPRAITIKPIFRPPEVAAFRSLRLSKEMMAEATLRGHRDGISNFNELVKVLLWNYLDRDPKYILQDPD